MTDNNRQARLAWQCRRGMLELDVILMPFFEQYFGQLGVDQQEQFEQLLTESDPDLYTWLMGFGECKNDRLLPIIGQIRQTMGLPQS